MELKPGDEKQRKGRPALRTKYGHASGFLLRLPDTFRARIRIYAGARGLSVNDAIVDLIADGWSQVPHHEDYEQMATRAVADATESLPTQPSEAPRKRRG